MGFFKAVTKSPFFRDKHGLMLGAAGLGLAAFGSSILSPTHHRDTQRVKLNMQRGEGSDSSTSLPRRLHGNYGSRRTRNSL